MLLSKLCKIRKQSEIKKGNHCSLYSESDAMDLILTSPDARNLHLNGYNSEKDNSSYGNMQVIASDMVCFHSTRYSSTLTQNLLPKIMVYLIFWDATSE